METVGPVDRIPSDAGMGAARLEEVIRTGCATGDRIHSPREEADHRMGHSWPETAGHTPDSLAARIVAARMATAGRMDLAGRAGRAIRCADRHLPVRTGSDCHRGEEFAFCLSCWRDFKRAQ